MPETEDNALGLYISIPFCRSKCTYCNFASGVYPASDHARYVDRLIEDLTAARARPTGCGPSCPSCGHRLPGRRNPSLLAPELLKRLFAAVRASFDLDPEAEITVECAPGQIADHALDALCEVG